ncbi:MAG: SsrA-binding protein [Candidatus Magasanikbacteria bacterium GW2011_GWC2_37_14]|uniref:SsrA-binding protein n=1 Tax=Candidatus Magasanikbacteria bacterium GW2011_GWC2_37_14 TaxID=1619046 RepID=A0A0G0GAL8_9BACT|nr:MAG: SsrA-binding protein [Candidatus Magasanikbacteria bacterium GW2011_GWC2_37_14]
MTPYAVNKKAQFDYELLEKYEAGLVLSGAEVKSIRNGHISLKGSFVNFYNNQAFLVNAHVAKYKFASNQKNYEPEHNRQLLLKDKEINYLRGKLQVVGLTIVPISLYNKGRHIKLEIAVARGKKKYDKRESIKKRELDREIGKKMKIVN